MPDPENQIAKLKERVTELESSQMHFQKDYDSLNEVVLDLANRLERMTLAVERLSRRVEANSEPESSRNLEDEKPPHY